MTETRGNLKAWREFRGITQTELARRVGVTKGEVSRLEGGSRRMTVEWMQKFADSLGIKLEHLLTPPPVYRNREEAINDSLRRDPGNELGIGPVRMSAGLFDVEGDEMTDTLSPGDAVIVDKSRKVPSPGGVFAIVQSGTPIIRRLQLMPSGQVRISCDNRRYDPVDVPQESVEILGRVVARIVRM